MAIITHLSDIHFGRVDATYGDRIAGAFDHMAKNVETDADIARSTVSFDDNQF